MKRVPLRSIPTNLIMGFLGVGKTSAILNLLEQKPQNEKWAVLVNEFGSIGIDGAILSNRGAIVKEVPGGCICCSVGLPFQVAVNRLLAQARPDRLLIEPSGLAHPRKILTQLSQYPFHEVLSLKASICLVDPRKLNDPRYINHETFVDQITLADVLVANKMDLADKRSKDKFERWAANCDPHKSVVAQVEQGKLELQWLDYSRNLKRQLSSENSPSSQLSNDPEQQNITHTGILKSVTSDHQVQTWGQIYPAQVVFNYSCLSYCLNQITPLRLKGIFNTNQGWFIFNGVDNRITINEIDANQDSRIEIIQSNPQWKKVEQALSACIETVV